MNAPRGLVLVGANYRTCLMDLREELLRRGTYGRLGRVGGGRPPWEDLIVLATCNRVEIYAMTRSEGRTAHAICEVLGMPADARVLYVLTGREAAAHLFRVACGLDSLAQGEGQVTAQVRRAPTLRPAARRRPRDLASLFERAAAAAPRLRRLAGLDGGTASASHAAVRFIEAVVPVVRPTIALLGSGKMARIAAGALRERADILVANRDRLKARDVAESLGGKGVSLRDLDQILERTDVILAATTAHKPLVTAARLGRALARRGGRPLWIVDLGFPRNVEAACRDLKGVTLVDIDGLAPWGSQALPPGALARAETRVREEAERFVASLRPASATDIASLRKAVEELRRREVEEALARLPQLSESDRAVVDKLATRLVNRVLHGPTERLRSFPEGTRSEIVHELLRGLGGERG